jgi:methionyl-tRNA formyltransferase
MMHIVLLCATNRGLRFLETLVPLCDGCQVTVMSFPEEPGEPAFFEAIREMTVRAGYSFVEARSVGTEKLREFWNKTPVDLLLAVSWRYLVPAAIFQRARRGAYVFHDSLLPKYRGFSPTVWAIINGEDHSGVTLFEMSESVDAGRVIDQQRVPIDADDTIFDVLERVTLVYLEMLRRNFALLQAGTVTPREQDHARASYTCRRRPEDNRIDWSLPAERIYNLIRAVTAPYAGAFTSLEGERLRIWSARRPHESKRYVGIVPGRVVEVLPGEGSVVLAGDGPLLLTRVQRDEGEVLCAANILDRLTLTLERQSSR